MRDFRFSLRALFFVTSMFIGAALMLSGRPKSGLVVMIVSSYVFYEARKTSLPQLLEKKRLAQIEISFGLIFLALGCYHWWQQYDLYSMNLFLGAVFILMGMARWIESRSLNI